VKYYPTQSLFSFQS